MATVNINSTIRQWDHIEILFQWGGIGDDHKINHWIDDSLVVKEGGFARHDIDYNGGEMETRRREGRPLPSMVTLSVKRADLVGDEELHTRMLAEAEGDGYVPEFTLKIIGYDYRNATTGEQLLFPNCIFSGGFEASQGSQHDPVPISIESPHAKATKSEVS